MTTEATHPPVLHETYFDRGSGCTYTGPNVDEPCLAEPVLHVLAGDDPDVLPSSLPACLDHAFFAIRAARTRSYWTAHPHAEGCNEEGEQLIVTGGCTSWRHHRRTPTSWPPTSCALCGHMDDEHGPHGCAADDEAAMGGCTCTAIYAE